MPILMILAILLMDISSSAVDFPWWAYLIVVCAWLGIECFDFILELFN